MAVLSRLDVDMCNVHAAGTIEMMKAAREGLTREDGTRPLLIAVTQLTSTSEERMRRELPIGASDRRDDREVRRNTKEAGLSTAWCRSPLEAGMVHEACGAEFLTVTRACASPTATWRTRCAYHPGRVRARSARTSFVVGRPITAASDPVAAYRRCVAEFLGA